MAGVLEGVKKFPGWMTVGGVEDLRRSRSSHDSSVASEEREQASSVKKIRWIAASESVKKYYVMMSRRVRRWWWICRGAKNKVPQSASRLPLSATGYVTPARRHALINVTDACHGLGL